MQASPRVLEMLRPFAAPTRTQSIVLEQPAIERVEEPEDGAQVQKLVSQIHQLQNALAEEKSMKTEIGAILNQVEQSHRDQPLNQLQTLKQKSREQKTQNVLLQQKLDELQKALVEEVRNKVDAQQACEALKLKCEELQVVLGEKQVELQNSKTAMAQHTEVLRLRELIAQLESRLAESQRMQQGFERRVKESVQEQLLQAQQQSRDASNNILEQFRSQLRHAHTQKSDLEALLNAKNKEIDALEQQNKIAEGRRIRAEADCRAIQKDAMDVEMALREEKLITKRLESLRAADLAFSEALRGISGAFPDVFVQIKQLQTENADLQHSLQTTKIRAARELQRANHAIWEVFRALVQTQREEVKNELRRLKELNIRAEVWQGDSE